MRGLRAQAGMGENTKMRLARHARGPTPATIEPVGSPFRTQMNVMSGNLSIYIANLESVKARGLPRCRHRRSGVDMHILFYKSFVV